MVLYVEQHTQAPQQKQNLVEKYLLTNGINSSARAYCERLCAWCLAEQGIEAQEGSHGICQQHASQVLTQWRERHRQHLQC